MATFTVSQVTSLINAMSSSGLTHKQLMRKSNKVQKLLSKKSPDFDQILAIFSPLQKNIKPKRPKNSWQLFLSEFREEIKKNGSNMSGAKQTQAASIKWAEMSEEEKEPFNEKALKLSAEYREKVNELNEICQKDEDSSDDACDSKSDTHNTDVSGDDEHDENSIQEKKKAKKKNKEIDEDFWGNMEELEWTRYENGDNFWEFVTKDSQYIIREGNGEKMKFYPREMKSEKAVGKSIAKQIEKKENDGFVYASL